MIHEINVFSVYSIIRVRTVALAMGRQWKKDFFRFFFLVLVFFPVFWFIGAFRRDGSTSFAIQCGLEFLFSPSGIFFSVHLRNIFVILHVRLSEISNTPKFRVRRSLSRVRAVCSAARKIHTPAENRARRLNNREIKYFIGYLVVGRTFMKKKYNTE